MKSALYFFSNPAHRVTDRMTDKHIASLAEVIIVIIITCLGCHSHLSFGRLLCSLGFQAKSVAELAAEGGYNILICQQINFFSQLRSRFSAQSMSRLRIFFQFWRRKSLNIRATRGRLHFCSSAFPRSCSDITAFCCTIPLFGSTARINVGCVAQWQNVGL